MSSELGRLKHIAHRGVYPRDTERKNLVLCHSTQLDQIIVLALGIGEGLRLSGEGVPAVAVFSGEWDPMLGPGHLLTSPFSGGSPLPKVLVTTRTRASCSRCTMSYSSMDIAWGGGTREGEGRKDEQ